MGRRSGLSCCPLRYQHIPARPEYLMTAGAWQTLLVFCTDGSVCPNLGLKARLVNSSWIRASTGCAGERKEMRDLLLWRTENKCHEEGRECSVFQQGCWVKSVITGVSLTVCPLLPRLLARVNQIGIEAYFESFFALTLRIKHI